MSFAQDVITDLDTMLDEDEFANPATRGGVGFSVMFEDSYQVADTVSGEVSTTQPQCIAKASDVDGIALGDEINITVLGTVKTFYVLDTQPDNGLVTLILSEEAPHGC